MSNIFIAYSTNNIEVAHAFGALVSIYKRQEDINYLELNDNNFKNNVSKIRNTINYNSDIYIITENEKYITNTAIVLDQFSSVCEYASKTIINTKRDFERAVYVLLGTVCVLGTEKSLKIYNEQLIKSGLNSYSTIAPSNPADESVQKISTSDIVVLLENDKSLEWPIAIGTFMGVRIISLESNEGKEFINLLIKINELSEEELN